MAYDIVPDGKYGRYQRIALFLAGLYRYDAIVIHQPGLELVALSLCKRLFRFGAAKLVGVDFQFSRPRPGLKGTWRAWIWRLVWSRVDLVLSHFNHSPELERYFGIQSDHFEYIPFKVNGYEHLDNVQIVDEGYVFTGGYSWRDYRLFCDAMALIPEVNAKIVTLNAQELRQHRTETTELALAANIELVEHDMNPDTWLDMLRRARYVVLPISAEAICSNGISVALQAMALGKPVIITPSPAVEGIFEDGRECLIVPHGDARAMADAIVRLQGDDHLRRRLAENGRKAALAFGGLDALMERISNSITERFHW